jgi:hypothetical protein
MGVLSKKSNGDAGGDAQGSGQTENIELDAHARGDFLGMRGCSNEELKGGASSHARGSIFPSLRSVACNEKTRAGMER